MWQKIREDCSEFLGGKKPTFEQSCWNFKPAYRKWDEKLGGKMLKPLIKSIYHPQY